MSNHDAYLRTTLSSLQYRDLDKTKRDALEALNFYRGLKPMTENFVFNNGIQKNLVVLNGTIPVNYKGNTYHIPVCIWLLDTHPYNAPMVYVKPTADMRIKVSRHVDHNGKVYLPYLHDWKHGQSDLIDLIQVLICTFQEQPPVYAVPTSPPSMMPQQQPTSVPYPVQNFATPYPPMPTMPLPAYNGMTSPPSAQPANSTGTLPFNVRPSLLTAAEEKLKRRLEEICLATEIEKQTGDQLKEGSRRLDTMDKRLYDEQFALQRNVDVCQGEIAQIEEKIAKSEVKEEEALIDDAILPPTPLYKQIVNAYAEEAALEDSIYYLGEALRSECGKVDLEQFLKHTRILARKQFMLKVLLHKCRQKAGLAG